MLQPVQSVLSANPKSPYTPGNRPKDQTRITKRVLFPIQTKHKVNMSTKIAKQKKFDALFCAKGETMDNGSISWRSAKLWNNTMDMITEFNLMLRMSHKDNLESLLMQRFIIDVRHLHRLSKDFETNVLTVHTCNIFLLYRPWFHILCAH